MPKTPHLEVPRQLRRSLRSPRWRRLRWSSRRPASGGRRGCSRRRCRAATTSPRRRSDYHSMMKGEAIVHFDHCWGNGGGDGGLQQEPRWYSRCRSGCRRGRRQRRTGRLLALEGRRRLCLADSLRQFPSAAPMLRQRGVAGAFVCERRFASSFPFRRTQSRKCFGGAKAQQLAAAAGGGSRRRRRRPPLQHLLRTLPSLPPAPRSAASR